MQQTEIIEQRIVLLRQAKMIHRSGLEKLPEGFDRQDVDDRFQLILVLIHTGKDDPNLQGST